MWHVLVRWEGSRLLHSTLHRLWICLFWTPVCLLWWYRCGFGVLVPDCAVSMIGLCAAVHMQWFVRLDGIAVLRCCVVYCAVDWWWKGISVLYILLVVVAWLNFCGACCVVVYSFSGKSFGTCLLGGHPFFDWNFFAIGVFFKLLLITICDYEDSEAFVRINKATICSLLNDKLPISEGDFAFTTTSIKKIH